MAFVAKHIFSLVTNQWGEAYVRGAAVSGCLAGGSVTTLFSGWIIQIIQHGGAAPWPGWGVVGCTPALGLAAGLCPAGSGRFHPGALLEKPLLLSEPV